MAAVLNYLLPIVLGLLGKFVAAFVSNLVKSRHDDPQLYAAIMSLVAKADTLYRPDQGKEKRAFVLTNMKLWAIDLGKDVSESALRSLVEMAVQYTKAN